MGTLAMTSAPDAIEAGVLLLLVGLGLFAIGAFLWTAWCMLTHKRWLVLGAECMQLRVGKRIGWEVPYQQIDQIALFRWLFGWPCLGVRLRVTEDFDRAWPHLAKRRVWSQGRRGFDLALRLDAASKPPERILETALACLHRFRAPRRWRGLRIVGKGTYDPIRPIPATSTPYRRPAP